MSDPHDGPLAESTEAKFTRVMKELAAALRKLNETSLNLSPMQAASLHALVDLGIAARTTRLLAAEGVARGLLPALRDVAVLIPCLGRRVEEMQPKWKPSPEPNLPWEATAADTAAWEEERGALLRVRKTREALLEITDTLYPR